MEYFPAQFKKILPAALLVTGLSACYNPSVSANTSSTKDPVVAPAGSVLRVRLDRELDSGHSRPGDRFTGTLDSPLIASGAEVLPKATVVYGHVVSAHSSKGQALLSVTLDSCQFNGSSIPLSTSIVSRVGGPHRRRNGTLIGERSATGAFVSGPTETQAGEGGTEVAENVPVSMPAKSLVGFTLRAPLVVGD